MHHDPRSIPLCIQHHIQLTSLSFQVSQPSHPWVTYSNFNIFTLKINSQGHGWGQILKWQCDSNILSTLIPFVPCQSAIPFLRYDFFKIWPWKYKVKAMDEVNFESHNMGPTFYRLTSLSFHVNRPSHSWDTTFQNLTLKIPGQGHGWGQSWKSQSGCNILSTHAFRSMSIGSTIPEIQHFQNLTLKIQGQGHWWGGHWKSQHGSNILSTHTPFISCQSAIPFLRYGFFKIWPWKSKVKVMGEGNVGSHKVGVTSYRLTCLSF